MNRFFTENRLNPRKIQDFNWNPFKLYIIFKKNLLFLTNFMNITDINNNNAIFLPNVHICSKTIYDFMPTFNIYYWTIITDQITEYSLRKNCLTEISKFDLFNLPKINEISFDRNDRNSIFDINNWNSVEFGRPVWKFCWSIREFV